MNIIFLKIVIYSSIYRCAFILVIIKFIGTIAIKTCIRLSSIYKTVEMRTRL